jgi:hypothetical protein
MSIPGTPTGGPFGKNALIYHDELVTTEIGQIQTQFDGPGHIGVNTSKGPMMYNGVISWDAYEHGAGGRVVGMGPLGVEHPAELGFVCRLVVLDAVAYKKSKNLIPANAEMLPIPTKPGDPGIVTADDVRGILQMQGLRRRLRGASHRPGKQLEQRPLQVHEARGAQGSPRSLREGRARLRPQRLRVHGGAGYRAHHVRYLGVRRPAVG